MNNSPQPSQRLELAPLQTLESQRRHSLSLSDPHSKLLKFSPPLNPLLSSPRPSSPYIFGDATIDAATASSRPGNSHHSRSSPVPSSSAESSISKGRPRSSRDSDAMVVDSERSSPSLPGSKPDSRGGGGGVGLHGKKRKAGGSPPDPISDPHLVGPGVPSSEGNGDGEPPAPKRRGSTVEASRIANLSLNDRRHSVDSRLAGPPFWNSSRRASGPLFSSPRPSHAAYPPSSSSVFSADPHRGHPPPGITSFAWPAPPSNPDHPSSSSNHHSAVPPGAHPPHPLDASSTPPTSGAGSARHPNPSSSASPLSMPPLSSFPPPDRRMSVPDMISSSSSPSSTTRMLRSRSRPPSRTVAETPDLSPSSPTAHGGGQDDSHPGSSGSSVKGKEAGSMGGAGIGGGMAGGVAMGMGGGVGISPYSRSPELRVSHKLAERKRRKEMKELFDELRDQLPADRGMKASKWEILTKAIDFVAHLKQANNDLMRENDLLRHDNNAMRHGGSIPPLQAAPAPIHYPPGHHPYPPHPGVHPHSLPPPPQTATLPPPHPPAGTHQHVPTSSSRRESVENVHAPSTHSTHSAHNNIDVPTSQRHQNGNSSPVHNGKNKNEGLPPASTPAPPHPPRPSTADSRSGSPMPAER